MVTLLNFEIANRWRFALSLDAFSNYNYYYVTIITVIILFLLLYAKEIDAYDPVCDFDVN